MTHRARPHGFTAEASRKQNAKYDEVAEGEAMEWIAAVLNESTLTACQGKDNVQAKLKNGIILCNLMNTVSPGAIPKVHGEATNNFKHMENVGNFLKAAEKYGCHRSDLFQTVDLVDNQNMVSVIGSIFALGRQTQKCGWDGPALGPKEATANPREFTEEQMMHGRVHGI